MRESTPAPCVIAASAAIPEPRSIRAREDEGGGEMLSARTPPAAGKPHPPSPGQGEESIGASAHPLRTNTPHVSAGLRAEKCPHRASRQTRSDCWPLFRNRTCPSAKANVSCPRWRGLAVIVSGPPAPFQPKSLS
jgi:hypothetical protein